MKISDYFFLSKWCDLFCFNCKNNQSGLSSNQKTSKVWQAKISLPPLSRLATLMHVVLLWFFGEWNLCNTFFLLLSSKTFTVVTHRKLGQEQDRKMTHHLLKWISSNAWMHFSVNNYFWVVSIKIKIKKNCLDTFARDKKKDQRTYSTDFIKTACISAMKFIMMVTLMRPTMWQNLTIKWCQFLMLLQHSVQCTWRSFSNLTGFFFF